MKASVDLARSYRNNGFVLARNLIPSSKLDEIAADISGVVVRRALACGLDVPRGIGREDLTAQLVALFEYDVATYVATAKLAQHLLKVHRLGTGPEIASILETLGLEVPAISTRPVIHFMADALRIAGGYHKTPPHQDWRSVQGSLDGITIWLPLFDVAAADYALEIAPASHRAGLLPSSDDAFGHRVAEGAVDEARFVPVPVDRGDALFFSGFLVHRTGVAGGRLVRIALSYRFNNAGEPNFIRRNYPDRYVYKAQMELLDADFPSPGDVARIFSPGIEPS